MKIYIDGISKEIPDNLTVAQLIEHLDEAGNHAVIELNGNYIAPKNYNRTTLKPEDRLEIIYPAFGG